MGGECTGRLYRTEESIFNRLTQIPGMGLITISHRHTLFKYHTKFLTYDGCGGYTYHQSDETSVSRMGSKAAEKVRLVTLIMEACKELGENWPPHPPE